MIEITIKDTETGEEKTFTGSAIQATIFEDEPNDTVGVWLFARGPIPVPEIFEIMGEAAANRVMRITEAADNITNERGRLLFLKGFAPDAMERCRTKTEKMIDKLLAEIEKGEDEDGEE